MSNSAAPARPWAGAIGRTRPVRRCRISNRLDRPNPPWFPACASNQSDRSICHWQIDQTVLWHPNFTGGDGDQRRPAYSLIRPNPSRSAIDQASDIAAKSGSPASIRRRLPTRQASRSITSRSSGIPTDRFDRRVESIESSTAFCASSSEVSGRTTRWWNPVCHIYARRSAGTACLRWLR